jgi:predicted nucleic acid-binding protein
LNRYLLDTTVLIDLSKSYRATEDALKSLVAGGGVPGVCAVCVAEFLAGVPPLWRQTWEQWIADFTYWEISVEAAALAGAWRFDLAREGRTIHVADALMAATALETDATLLTNNIKDFPIQGLRLLRLGR